MSDFENENVINQNEGLGKSKRAVFPPIIIQENRQKGLSDKISGK